LYFDFFFANIAIFFILANIYLPWSIFKNNKYFIKIMGRQKTKPAPKLPMATQRLAQVIRELGISRAHFAERLGMSSSGINALFLKENTQISVVQAKAVECEFGVSYRWLLDGIGSRWFAQYDRLRPSERWLLKHGSPEAYPSMATMVDIPMNLDLVFSKAAHAVDRKNDSIPAWDGSSV